MGIYVFGGGKVKGIQFLSLIKFITHPCVKNSACAIAQS